jgi:hypothetical protein
MNNSGSIELSWLLLKPRSVSCVRFENVNESRDVNLLLDKLKYCRLERPLNAVESIVVILFLYFYLLYKSKYKFTRFDKVENI